MAFTFSSLTAFGLLPTVLAEYLKIDVKDAHRALADVETTVWLLRHLAYQVIKN